MEEKIWTEEKNKKILQARSYIIGLKNSKSKTFIQAQIDQLNREIEKNQLELSKMELEKEELIGFTAEAYATRRINEHYMYNAFRTSEGEFLFSREEFEELRENKVTELISTYNENGTVAKGDWLKSCSTILST